MALEEAPPQAPGWRIEVPALDVEGAPGPRALVLSNVCVSTRGNRYQRLEVDGKRYFQGVDPRTGQALTDQS
jgi:thiamine biosynthesis lipoprotein ApbE